jgi:hypothetical protein
MRKYHVPFWRAVEEATPSLTLIIALVGLFINQPGGTGLSCKLSRTIRNVQLNLFDDFRATENPDLSDSRSG